MMVMMTVRKTVMRTVMMKMKIRKRVAWRMKMERKMMSLCPWSGQTADGNKPHTCSFCPLSFLCG